MLISLESLIKDYDLKINGVLHVGAHYGQEYKDYIKNNIKAMIFFEPLHDNFTKLMQNVPINTDTVLACNCALGNETCEKEMYVETANGGMSCSLLEPGTHLTQYPHITFDGMETVQVERLDNIAFDRTRYNMINIDVQGYELEVFKGAAETLDFIDIIYSEVNRDEVYKGCAKVEEIDAFLSKWGFERVVTDWAGGTWGDCLYLKKEI